MAIATNIPITDNTTLLNTLKSKAQALPSKSTESTGSVDLSGITATADDILAGKKSVNTSGDEITGTMTNRGAWTTSKTSNGDVTIPAGYHNGNGKVTVNVSTTVASGELDTPTVSFDTTTGMFTTTAKVKTSGYISTSATKTNSYGLARNLGGTITPAKDSQTISLSGQYCTGDYVVNGDSNLVATNIKNGISIFGVTGTYSGDTTNKQYRTSSATPTFGNTDDGYMCSVIENGVCAITPAYLLLYADPGNWATLSSWSGNLIVAAFHDVAENLTSVIYCDTYGALRTAQYGFSNGSDRGYYRRNGGYVSWGFRDDEYSTGNGNAKYNLIYMS